MNHLLQKALINYNYILKGIQFNQLNAKQWVNRLRAASLSDLLQSQ